MARGGGIAHISRNLGDIHQENGCCKGFSFAHPWHRRPPKNRMTAALRDRQHVPDAAISSQIFMIREVTGNSSAVQPHDRPSDIPNSGTGSISLAEYASEGAYAAHRDAPANVASTETAEADLQPPSLGLEQIQQKWVPVLRPELRENKELECVGEPGFAGRALDWRQSAPRSQTPQAVIPASSG